MINKRPFIKSIKIIFYKFTVFMIGGVYRL